MTEPIYTYVKGKGWLVLTHLVTLGCGTTVTLEPRMPQIGERYVWAYKREYNVTHGVLTRDMEMNIDKWKVTLKGWCVTDLETFTRDDVEFYRERPASFLVITKV